MKLKFQQNNIELCNNSQTKTDIKFVFSFNNTIITNAKNHVGSFKINKFDDLQHPGSFAKLNDGHTIVVSLGEQNKFSISNYQKSLKVIADIIKNNTKLTSVSIVIEETLSKNLNQNPNEFTENSIFHLFDSLYYFDELKSKPKKLNIKVINFITQNNQTNVIKNALTLVEGMYVIKDLSHSPANIVTPTTLAQTASNFSKISKKVKIEILEEKDARKLKMNAFLAVAQGADSKPKFIKMEYQGADKNKKPIVLVGKGITFDTGGISLKPGANMDAMKYDMCGAATVLGLFQTVARLELPINLVGLIPSCENMPSGRAVKPGDVITTMSGKTVEVVNTDAEGRLILCDALTYAQKYKPELVIDMATLTGACIVALGTVNSGLYSNDDVLAEKLIKAGLETNDRTWRMPLYSEYHDMLKGSVADLKNIGSWQSEAGSVTAACFLEQFTNYKWAHLDIAGVAKDGNGRPFPMMINFLRNFKK